MTAGPGSLRDGAIRHTDLELRLLLKVTRRFPRIRGFGRLGGLVARLYGRKDRPEIAIDVLGHSMALDPNECVDSALLFCPQLYERLEVQCLRKFLRPGDSFLDAGANIGFYSLVAAGLVGPSGRVLAVEADPATFEILARNATANRMESIITLVNAGLSDRSESLRLGLNLTGNRGGNSFLTDGDEGVSVKCEPLVDVLRRAGLERIDVAKFDIEGFEHRVLKALLESAPPMMVPRVMIIEQNQRHLELGAGDAVGLLRQHGYEVSRIKDQNYLAIRGE